MSTLTSKTTVTYRILLYKGAEYMEDTHESSFFSAVEEAKRLVQNFIERDDYENEYHAKIETLVVPIYR